MEEARYIRMTMEEVFLNGRSFLTRTYDVLSSHHIMNSLIEEVDERRKKNNCNSFHQFVSSVARGQRRPQTATAHHHRTQRSPPEPRENDGKKIQWLLIALAKTNYPCSSGAHFFTLKVRRPNTSAPIIN